MAAAVYARLLNGGGELIAEGLCRVDEAAGTAMLEPEREPGAVRKERGNLALELETGRSLQVSARPIIFRLRPTVGSGDYKLRTLYRLRLMRDSSFGSAQEATAAGGAREGSLAPPERETPAAR